MQHYFAYGANMDAEHMAARVPSAAAVGPGRLDGFRLTFSVYSTEWRAVRRTWSSIPRHTSGV
jgi:hypothetical protein